MTLSTAHSFPPQSSARLHAVYLHIPLCRRRCSYCDFTSYVVRETDIRARVVRGLLLELALTPRLPARTLYLGGGTPNILSAEQLGGLVARARDHFSMPWGAEVSVEANPSAHADSAYLEALVRAGVTRLSVGFQSFEPSELEMLERLHDAGETDIFREARRAGIRSVSIDLMYGLPGQRPETVRRSLERALELEVDHLSLYCLKLEPGTPLARAVEAGELPAPDPDLSADVYLAALELLEGAGLQQYELSNFARPGHRCRHNEVYWAAEPFIGIGPSAVGDDGRERRRVTPDLQRWLESVEREESPPVETETPTAEERRMEQAMLALRTRDGLSRAVFLKRWGVEFQEAFPDMTKHLTAGRIEFDGRRYRLARAWQPLSDRILSNLVGG